MAGIWFQGSEGQFSQMTVCFTNVNGVSIAYRVQGKGPPLALVMGYRLNSAAWPAKFIQQLARRFTVITFDNRGTGQSDKPVEGYAIANMARDVYGVLDELGVAEVYMLGYSMGGAIAQEFLRQFPERVAKLILCATLAGGAQASYAKSSVVSVMRELDGLSPEQAARRIWKVTYAPGYLERHRTLAEEQMRREIALPTPLHAADLQFQAFAEFDGSHALSQIRCPTMVMTGDLDQLIPPQNSLTIAPLIPNAKLYVIAGAGHRVLWEATDTCVDLIAGFLGSDHSEPGASVPARAQKLWSASHPFASAMEFFATWPSTLATVCVESLTIAQQSILVGGTSRFGDGKPIVLVPGFLGSDVQLLMLSSWLRALGYRPVTAGLLVNFQDGHSEQTLSHAIRDVTQRIGRKGILMTHSSSLKWALRTAEAHLDFISDVVAFGASHRPKTTGPRTHFVASGWSILQGIIELPRLLRSIGIELIEQIEASDGARQSRTQAIAEVEQG
jgi:pimeloyl-ACP methyl ester carboxylesterase